MPSNKETKPEKRETHTIEQYPKDKSATVRKLGETAMKGASKDKSKK